MLRRGQNKTSSLLQKVNSQLRGERVPLKTKEEDELSNYLSTLTQKTGQQSKSVNFEDYGENISISSDSSPQKTPRIKTPPIPAGTASRFLKKKQPEPQSHEPKVITPTASPRGPRRSYRPATTIPNASPQKGATPQQKSTPYPQKTAALDKVQALTSKINERSAVNNRTAQFDFDTDDSVSLANYMQSADQLKSASEKSIGKDGNRFLKKTKAEKPLEDSDKVDLKKVDVIRPSTPTKGHRRPFADRADTNKAAAATVPEYAAKGKVKYVGNVQLTSEEESMADFISRLSADEARKKSKKKSSQSKGRDLQSPDLHSFKQRTPSPPSRSRLTPSPIYGRRSPHQRLSRSPSQDSDNIDSIHSEVVDTQETESSANLFQTVNLMDLDSLEPLPLSPEPSEKKKKKTSKKTSKHKDTKSKSKSQSKPASSIFKAPEKEDVFKAKGSSKKDTPKQSSSFFNNFGLHTVDELLGGVESQKEESIASEASEIITEKSDIFVAKKKRDSVSSIAEEIGRETPQRHMYSDDFEEDSITERIGQSSIQGGKQVHWSAASEVRTEYSDENTQADYGDDFESDSQVRSRTDRTYDTESDGYTSDTDTYTRSSCSDSRRSSSPPLRRHVETKSVEIQTPTEPGLNYRWNMMSGGLAISGPNYGLGFVDPTPIATHVVSADALEALTSYSPCMLALQDLLKQQFALTQNFLDTQRRIYDATLEGLESNFHYTTLEDTKEYIRQHRKPRLTFKQALKMVSKEM